MWRYNSWTHPGVGELVNFCLENTEVRNKVRAI